MPIKLLIRLFQIVLTLSCASAIQAGQQQFIALSDIHFDPYQTCGIKAHKPCLVLEKLQKAPSSQWDTIFKKYEPQTISHYGFDTNAVLLHSVLSYVKTLPSDESFILITGDFLAHDYFEKFKIYSSDKSLAAYEKFVTKTFEYVGNELIKAFPDKAIYFALGNNDSFHGDYYSSPNDGFYRMIRKILLTTEASRLKHTSIKDTFLRDGFYSVKPFMHSSNKLLVLNTNSLSEKAKGNDIGKSSELQLAWLERELEKAKRKHYKVWIVFHIPSGIDVFQDLRKNRLKTFWREAYNERFIALQKKYSNTISSVISGHLHMDGFQLLNGKHHPIPNVFVPAVSPVYHNNPAFKVFYVDDDTSVIKNFETYYYDYDDKRWKKEYNFNEVYNPGCHRCSILKGYKNIKLQGSLTQKYLRYYRVSAAEDFPENFINHGYWNPNYWCGIHYQSMKDYLRCMHPYS